jgi:hypothetical protein
MQMMIDVFVDVVYRQINRRAQGNVLKSRT